MSIRMLILTDYSAYKGEDNILKPSYHLRKRSKYLKIY